MKTKTIGVAPKAQLATLLSAIGAVVTALVAHWLHADSYISVAVTAAVAALFAFIGAWLGAPGVVVGGVPATPNPRTGQHLTPRQNVASKEPK